MTSDTIIHCHTPTDKTTVQYVKFMWETMLKLAHKPELLKLHTHCIGPTAAKMCEEIPQSEAHHVERATEGGSFGHAACIMDAFKMMTDECIHIICDSDAFVVARGWDNIVRIKVSQGFGILGTTYEDIGGINTGVGHVQTYKRIPTFTWAILAPNIPWPSLDVTPDKGRKITIANESMAAIYNLPIGHSVFGEAGWQLPEFLHNNQIKYEGWKQLKPSRNAVVLKGLSDYHEEYHVDEIPFIVHHRGSLRHRYRESRLSKEFFEKVDAWINNELENPPKWTTVVHQPWTQLPLEFGYKEPEQQRKLQPTNVVPEGWLKVTVDTSVTRGRGAITSRREKIDYKHVQKTPHIRIEGASNVELYFEVPDVSPHSFIVRNMMNVSATIAKGPTGATTTLGPGDISMLMVDVDGVFRVR